MWVLGRVAQVFLFGEPPADAVLWRRHATTLFFSGNRRSLVSKLAIIKRLANGDWRNTSAVEHYSVVDHGDVAYQLKVKRQLADGLCEVLASAAPFVYPRSRWDGCEQSVEDIGRMAALHGILKPVYEAYVGSFRTRRGGGRPEADGVGNDGAEVRGDEGDQVMADADAGAAGQGIGEDGHELHLAVVERSIPGMQQENEIHRSKGLEFVRVDPLPFLIYTRLCMEPLRCHRMAVRFMSGEGWERSQLVAEAKAHASTTSNGPARNYRVLVCAELVLEKMFFHKVKQMFAFPELFELMPINSRFESLNSQVFVIDSRMGALMELLVAHPSRGYPLRLFLMIRNRALAAVLRADSACMDDDFSEKFKAQNDLTSDDCYYRLIAIALVASVDMADIERLHAVIRRLLYVKSTHVAPPNLEKVSADIVAYTHRRRRQRVVFGLNDPSRANPPASSTEPDREAKRYKPGEWRAFSATLQERDNQGRFQPGSSHKYRDLDAGGKATIAELAKTAAQAIADGAIRCGETTFGRSSRDLNREMRLRADNSRALQLRPFVGNELQVGNIVENVLRSCPDTAMVPLECKRQLRVCSRLMARKVHEEDRMVVSCISKLGKPLLEAKHGGHHVVQSLARMCVAVPHIALQTFEVRPPSASNEALLVSRFCGAGTARSDGKSDVGKCLDAHWRQHHTLVYHDNVPKIGPLPPRHRRCREAGICLCSIAGKLLYRLRNALHREMRNVYPRGSDLRAQYLAMGKVFMRFVGEGPDDQTPFIFFTSASACSARSPQSSNPWSSWR